MFKSKFCFRYFWYFAALVLAPAAAYASGSTFDSSSCNVLNIVMGTPGKVFAGFAVVSTGFGFFSGKMSWGLCVGIVAGIGVTFGAPSVVSAVTGESMFVCEQGTQYVSTCNGSSCYSCPIGFSGENCDQCAIGYAEPNCDGCAVGYSGYNCSQCDALNGYKSSGSYCYQACSVSFLGVKAGTVVDPTISSKSLSCDDDGFAGSITYTCVGSTFAEDPGQQCACAGNREGVNCDSCKNGYDLANNCESLLSGFYEVNGRAQPECDVSGETITGVDTVALGSVLPDSGVMGCTVLGYDGQIDYLCEDGSFSYTGSCSCAQGYVGANCDQCDVGYNRDPDPNSNECRKGCDITYAGVSATWVNHTLVEESVQCDNEFFEGDLFYTCDVDGIGFEEVANNCVCVQGHMGSDCKSCDINAGYSDVNGVCMAGCKVSEQGSNVTWVSPTDTPLSIPCNMQGYDGSLSLNYTCANNNFATSDSCSCLTGFDLAQDCLVCDEAGGFRDDGNSGCSPGCNIAVANIAEDWIGAGLTTLNCVSTPDNIARSISFDCSNATPVITSPNNSCTCPVGYSGPTCSVCDTANGYQMNNGQCRNGCDMNVEGISVSWVQVTSSTQTEQCDVQNYAGSISYSCAGSGASPQVSGSCSCAQGFAGVNCASCDTQNHYFMFSSNSCSKACAVPTNIANINDIQIPQSGHVVQGSGSLTCNSSSTPGINNRSSISYTCDGNGNFNSSLTTCACDPGYTGANCDQIDSGAGYVDDGNGNPIMSCDVSLPGISETLVTEGGGTLYCGGNFVGSINYNCDANRNLNESGSCSCATGYTGANCSQCDTGYTMVGAVCQQQCEFNGVTGIVDGTKVNDGTTSIYCNHSSYDSSNSISYSCSGGSLTNISGTCSLLPACSSSNVTPTVSGNYKIFVFNSNGILSCNRSVSAELLIVGGGGGGGFDRAGGGGGGQVIHLTGQTLTAGSHSVTIGGGGSGSSDQANNGGNGLTTSFFGHSAIGGGGGGSSGTASDGEGQDGSAGASGGGGGFVQDNKTNSGGAGNAGNNGKSGIANNKGGGGGGAGSAATNMNGGSGLGKNITGSTVYYGAGGGGGSNSDSRGDGGSNNTGGRGGNSSNNAVSAAANTGSGGGGGGSNSGSGGDREGRSGSSGIVVIKYLEQ